MTILLALLYPIAIQYEREVWPLWVQQHLGLLAFPSWLRSVCKIFAGIALIIDVAANWTELSLALWEWPRRGEWTFSTRLERLVRERGWRSDIALQVSSILNFIAPSGKHIK